MKLLNLFATLLCFSLAAKEITISWNPVPGASSYSVKYGSANLEHTRTVTTTNIVIDVVENTDYFATVKAINNKGQSLPSKALFFKLASHKKTNILETPKPFITPTPIIINLYGHADQKR